MRGQSLSPVTATLSQEPSRVDFYVLPEKEPAARLRFACRLAEKAWHLRHRVHLHTDCASTASSLDDLLWTFRQGSFVPHEILRAGAPASSPVTIGYGSDAPPGADLLVNLGTDLPEFVMQFPRVAEIVDSSDSGRQQGRERYRQYRQLGIEPVTHNIEATP